VAVSDDDRHALSSGPYWYSVKGDDGNEHWLTGTFISTWQRAADEEWYVLFDAGDVAQPNEVTLAELHEMQSRLSDDCVAPTMVSDAPAVSAMASQDAARQFDFWLGDWMVYQTASGQHIGHNRIERAHNDRVLIEHWTGLQGGSGTSLNTYDTSTSQWVQTWMGSGGAVRVFYGSWDDATRKMTLQTRPEADPALVMRRGVWTLNPDGSVRQEFLRSDDLGVTWTTNFDAIYRRAQDHVNAEDAVATACVQRVLEADTRLGQERDQASLNRPVGTVARRYADALKQLDFTDCPPPFTSAFARHAQAWAESADFLDRFAEERGELHALFTAIKTRKEGAGLADHEAHIWSTWAEVTAAMQ